MCSISEKSCYECYLFDIYAKYFKYKFYSLCMNLKADQIVLKLVEQFCH